MEARIQADPATSAAFLALVTIAGGNAVAIRFTSCATCELDPFWGATMRFAIASTILVLIACALHAAVPRGRALVGAVLFGALQFGAGFGLVYLGLVHAPAGLGQVLLASVPLSTFLLAMAHRQERFRWDGLAGALLAICGIATVFVSGAGTGVPLASMVAVVLGAVCWSEALVVVKAFPPVHPAAMNAVAMAVGAVILLVLAMIVGEAFAVPATGTTWAAQAYLVLGGSVGVFWLYVIVLRRWTASAASYQMVLIPLVTVGLSVLLQGEQVTWLFAVGSLCVLAGVYLGALRPSSPAPRPRGRPSVQ
jgi:drug/metabolite transporter (DMT)-like permease